MKQLDIFENNFNSNGLFETGFTNLDNGEYLFISDFFTEEESDFYFRVFLESIRWKQESMNMYGNKVYFPRLTAWYGDNDKPYTFSGLTLHTLGWTPELLAIKKKIEQKTNIIFNSVLLNLYRNGNDSISWHTDAEPELGKNPVIVSVNFGAARKFQLRHIYTKQKLEIELSHGSVLIMQGELQHFWQHQVPKTKELKGERINLTFRVIK